MDPSRIGKFTSSQIWKLMTLATDKKNFGKPALTYIKEKRREIDLGIEINIEATSHSLSWGSAMEGYVYDTYIGVEYALESKKTTVHDNKIWCGTKDVISSTCVGDVKCPSTRSSFCDLVDIINQGDIENFKSEAPDYYWQLVSNSILENVDYAELVVWIPYESEIPAIVEYIDGIDDFQLQKDIQWVLHEDVTRIPHIPDNSKYKNINRFKFLVPPADKKLLTEKVTEAGKLLVPFFVK